MLSLILSKINKIFLKISTDPEFMKLFEKIRRYENLLSPNVTESLIRALKSKLALFSDQATMRNSLRKLSVDDQCLVSHDCFIELLFL